MSDVWAVPKRRYHCSPACAHVAEGAVTPPRMSIEQAEAFGLKPCKKCMADHAEVTA
jgi:methylphosphotriester-DNA--protein-cysteine methyltransferase